MEIIGKLIQKLPLQSGISRTGSSWQKQEFVIETQEQYPKKVCINLWGDKTDQLAALDIDTTLKVSFSLESREFNGKWYTDVRAWKIEAAAEGPSQGSMLPAAPAARQMSAASNPNADILPPYVSGGDEDTFTDSGSDDLPF